MTEAEWNACIDPTPMLEFLRGKASDRKLRHFVVTCARRVLPASPDTAMTDALDAAERFADGLAKKGVLTRSRDGLKPDHGARVARWFPLYTSHIRSVPAWHATREQIVRAASEGSRCAAWASTSHVFAGSVAMTYPNEELAAQAQIIRDLFGPLPFRSITFVQRWRAAPVTSLAQAIYNDRDFDRMPILADALEDAGCTDPDILEHCRSLGPHLRGCWAVDLVLAKN